MDWNHLKKFSGMELVWAAIGIISFVLALYSTYTDGIAESYPLFIIVLIAALMFVVRKRMREHTNNEK